MPVLGALQISRDSLFAILDCGFTYSGDSFIRIELDENQISPAGSQQKNLHIYNFHLLPLIRGSWIRLPVE